MLFKLILFAGLFAAFADDATDPKILDVNPLTSDQTTDNRMPMFSSSGRLVYFRGSGLETYGTTCPHIYQLDLSTNDISLYSTGLGRDERVASKNDNNNFVVSTTPGAFKIIQDNKQNANFNNDLLCPVSHCEDSKLPTTTATLCNAPHYEHYPDEGVLIFDSNGQVSKVSPALTRKSTDGAQWQNPGISFSVGEKNVDIKSGVIENNKGEKIYYRTSDYPKKTNYVKNFVSGNFDGFQASTDSNVNSNQVFFFHGYQINKLPNTEQQTTLTAMKAGIIPQKGSRIFMGQMSEFVKTKGNPPVDVSSNAVGVDHLWPQAGPDNSHVLVTAYEQSTSKWSLYSVITTGAQKGQYEKITTDAYNSFHGAMDPTYKYIVFSSTRNGGDNGQLYAGKYPADASTPNMTFPKVAPIALGADFSKYIKTPYNYLYNPDNTFTGVRYPKPNKDGKVIMYTATDKTGFCPQIYQMNTKWQDIQVRRKMSSGIHYYETPNFLGDTTDIVYAATLTRDYTSITQSDDVDALAKKCSVVVCTEESSKTDELKNLCTEGLSEKSLPDDMELYISNHYGSIKQRLTTNDKYDGELTVFGQTAIYSAYGENDFDLHQMDLSNANPASTIKKITSTLGFEAGVAFNADGTIIAYYATRPDDADLYQKRLAKKFVDIAKTNIYVYHLTLNKEVQVSKFSGRAHSPIFVSATKLAFLYDDDASGNSIFYTSEFSCDTKTCTFKDPVKLEQYNTQIGDLFYDSKKGLLFADSKGIYLSEGLVDEGNGQGGTGQGGTGQGGTGQGGTGQGGTGQGGSGQGGSGQGGNKGNGGSDTTTTTTTTQETQTKGASAIYGPRILIFSGLFAAVMIWIL